MAGMDKSGLKIKRQLEVIKDLKASAVPIFQDLVPVGDIVDTSENSTLGRIIGLYSEPISDLWEVAQAVYNSFDPDSAVGRSLDDIVAYGGLIRKDAFPTRADVYVYGDVGLNLSEWHKAKSSTTGNTYGITKPVVLSQESCHGVGIVVGNTLPNYQYVINYRPTKGSSYIHVSYVSGDVATPEGIIEGLMGVINDSHPSIKAREEDGRLWVEGEVELSLFEWSTGGDLLIDKVVTVSRVEAMEEGSWIQPPNTIDSIATPSFGWDAVRNPFSAVTGREEETDEELRERFTNSKFVGAINIIESLFSSLYAIDGVDDIVIYENVEDYEDDNGLPPHSFTVIIDGGLDSEIGSAIWLNKPSGIRPNGNTEVDVIDSYGYVRSMRFDRPELLELYVKVELTRLSDYPPNGDESIKTALSEYVNKLTIGNELIFSRLYTPINSVLGHQVDNLQVSLDGEEWNTNNVIPAIHQRIVLRANNITVI